MQAAGSDPLLFGSTTDNSWEDSRFGDTPQSDYLDTATRHTLPPQAANHGPPQPAAAGRSPFAANSVVPTSTYDSGPTLSSSAQTAYTTQAAPTTTRPRLYPDVPPPTNANPFSSLREDHPEAAAEPLSPSDRASDDLSYAIKIVVHSPRSAYATGRIPGLERQYITYEVTTVTTLPQFSASQVSVRRRFSDFVALANLLPVLYPGCFLPQRPHRDAMGSQRMHAAFIEDRRVSLERYLNRLARHRGVLHGEAMHLFLELDTLNLRASPQWRSLSPRSLTVVQSTARFFRQLVGSQPGVPAPSQVVHPAAVHRDYYRLLHEQMAKMKGAVKQAEVSPEEDSLRGAAVLLEDGRQGLQAACQKATSWMRTMHETSDTHGELAGAFNDLYRFEQQYNRDARSLSIAAQGCGQAQTLIHTCCTTTVSALQSLHDELEALPNALHALQQREQMLLTVQTMRRDLAAAEARKQVAETSPRTPLRSIERMNTEMGGLHAALEAAQSEYERLTRRNLQDFHDFQVQRSKSLLAMLRDVAMLQKLHAEQAAGAWQEVADALPRDVLRTVYSAQQSFGASA